MQAGDSVLFPALRTPQSGHRGQQEPEGCCCVPPPFSFVLEFLSCPSASQRAWCRLRSLILHYPPPLLQQVQHKVLGMPRLGRNGGDQVVGRETGWQRCAEIFPGPPQLMAMAAIRGACVWCAPCISCLFPAMSMLGLLYRAEEQGNAGELWCRQDPFSVKKGSVALICCAGCHRGSAVSPSGLGWLCSLRVALPQPLQSLNLLLHVPCSW